MNKVELNYHTTPQRLCGWCPIELAPGTLPATHGICPACYVRLQGEMDRLARAGSRRAI
jgi:hypothetical protein